MKKLDLPGWASVAEIVASIAVVVSLLFVAYSVKRNTEEMAIANTNFMYELDARITADLSSDPALAAITVKVEQGQALSEIEKLQYLHLQHRYLTVWEIAWTHYHRGSLDEDEWLAWNQYYGATARAGLPREWWREIRAFYKPAFAAHVEAAYAGR
ncbi:MAG: hypothetical protein GTN86_04640 [Xanthomonadales bacterium]|nr:hypothetical protein [Xanthomonadales bacterium]NIN59265.1 hypothetical protein [Xanthomonadales bacterium]NIN74616.1 hypothetical protein [Xanthomonadales bacterium]NIO12562.1 hypothetical protein [Xanthomonadales bacterium]NIP11658.1 hypothetical protein [Xanthomonadales bacterium]